MNQKTRKQRQAEQLGMPMGTARSKLHRKLIWNLLVSDSKNVCAHCDDWVSSPEDLAITHIKPWLDSDPDLFWDLRNVAFMHPSCAESFSAQRDVERRQKEKETMHKNNLVSVIITNEGGERLPGCFYNDKIYVAGKHGERYKILLRNNTSERLEVVLTVDGRDVVSGEPGSKENRGYLLKPFESYSIDGWRTSDTTVAAFRFGADKDKAYSSQLGTGAHLGVIGAAVFKERASYSGGILRGVSSFNTSSGGGGFIFSGDSIYSTGVSYSTDTLTLKAGVTSTTLGPQVNHTPQNLREEVKLGTKFGEEIQSSVYKSSFTRVSHIPAQMVLLEYDTLKNLKKRGVPITQTKPRAEPPSAFPADNNGFCKPPAQR